jgi:Fe2+ or Zn2+ uptake regulation protein
LGFFARRKDAIFSREKGRKVSVRERQTKQKNMIYAALTELNHPTATEVYGYVHEQLPSVSRATVFRVLGGFASSGKALELKLAGSDVRYDYNVSPHCHIRCRICGKVADASLSEKFPILEGVTDSCGFRVDGFQIEFFGVCPDCLGKENDNLNS